MGQGSLIGYEINEKTCQISYYSEEQMEPQTLEVDEDNFQIPSDDRKTSRYMGIWKRSKKTGNGERRIYRDQAFETGALQGKDLNLAKRRMMQYGFCQSLSRCHCMTSRR